MTESIKYQIASSVSTTYKQCSIEWGCTTEEINNNDVIDFIKEDLIDKIKYISKINNVNLNNIVESIEKDVSIYDMFTTIDKAVDGIKNHIDLPFSLPTRIA